LASTGRDGRPDVALTDRYQLRLDRLLIRANHERAALVVARRFARATGCEWETEYLGRYWKIEELAELRAVADLEAAGFGDALAEGIGALCGAVTSLSVVRVDRGKRTASGVFAAAPNGPTGTSIPGLEWFSFEIAVAPLSL